MTNTVIDLSLANHELYDGCDIEIVAGRANLTTPISEAVNIVGKNIAAIVERDENRTSVTLTGAMAVWSYLIVFHAVVHRYTEVLYNDGRNPPVCVARHGR